ncbi:MAG: hypothetical protein ACFB10_07480 [Salibacteraceae bacterium]
MSPSAKKFLTGFLRNFLVLFFAYIAYTAWSQQRTITALIAALPVVAIIIWQVKTMRNRNADNGA